ncbi:MAG: asparagine synthase-related protein [Pseudomonadota bacterium]
MCGAPLAVATGASNAVICQRSDAVLIAADCRPYSDSPEVDLTGPDAEPDRIEGDFAVAIWNRTEGTLALWRDPMGIRPLFHATGPEGTFAFCSLPLPLVDAGFASGAPQLRPLLGVQMAQYWPGSQTMLQGIRRVPHGHCVTFSNGALSTRRYAVLQSDRQAARRSPEDNAIAACRLLSQAVRRRLPQTGPVASQCSGGLDSSALTVLAANHLAPEGREVLACCAAAPERDGLDRRDGLQNVHSLVQSTPGTTLFAAEHQRPEATWAAPMRRDAPTHATGTADPMNAMFAEAAARGIPMLLSGFGGDETISSGGLGEAADALARLHLPDLLRAARKLARIEGKSPWQVVARDVANRMLSPRARTRVRRWFGADADPMDRLAAYLTPEGHRLIGGPSTPWRSEAGRRAKLDDGRLAQNAEYMAIFAAKYGISVAFPFLDRDLVAFSLGLPADVLTRDGERRWLMRRAMQGVLPEMIRTEAEKIVSDNGALPGFAAIREQLLGEIDRLSGTVAARYFDLDRMRRDIEALPTYEAALAEAQANTEAGRRTSVLPLLFTSALPLAQFLAQNEGTEDGTPEDQDTAS